MKEALIEIVGGVALTFLISFIIKKILPRLAKRTRSEFDDFIFREITNLIFPLGSLVVLLLAEDKLQLPGGLNRPYEIILTIAAAVVVIRLINRIGIRLLQSIARRSGREDIEQLIKTLLNIKEIKNVRATPPTISMRDSCTCFWFGCCNCAACLCCWQDYS